jgi:hypothetical protein
MRWPTSLHLGADLSPAFFYDPATKRLRSRFARYVEGIDNLVVFLDQYIKTPSELLTQIQAERKRH